MILVFVNSVKRTYKMTYTLIIDYIGSTYVLQSTGENPDSAAINCINDWNTTDIEFEISNIDKIKIQSLLKKQSFINLNGLHNVWCGSILLNNELMLFNIVLTYEKT